MSALLAIGLACPACLGMVLGRLPCRGAFKHTANCMSLKLLIWFLLIDVILLRSACLAYDAQMPSDVLHIQCHALVTNGLFLSAVLRSFGAFASSMPYSVFKCADFPWNLLFFGSLECATCTHNRFETLLLIDASSSISVSDRYLDALEYLGSRT